MHVVRCRSIVSVLLSGVCFLFTQALKYNVTLSTDNEHEYTCPITQHSQGSTAKFAEEVRRNSRAEAQGSCPNKKQVLKFSK